MSGQSTLIIDPLRVRGWQRNMHKQLILESVWEQFSNRTAPTTQLPNGQAMKTPADVVHRVSDQFRPGVQFTTIPSTDKLKQKGKGGSQSALGTGEKVKLRYSRVYYNVQRKVVTFADGSVDGDLVSAYNIADQRVNLLTDYFKELSDYNYTRAIIEGADEYLTEDEYWTGDNITSAPIGKIMHPKVTFAGATSFVAHAGVYATDIAKVKTDVNALYLTAAVNAGTYKFTKTQLDKLIRMAARRVMPLSWNMNGGGGKVKFIIMISANQSQELSADTSSGGWFDTMKNAGERGIKNRAISGIFGYYKESLIIVNERQPLFDTKTATAANDIMQYVKPWNDSGSTDDIYSGDNRVPKVKTTDDGTCEIAIVLGKGAIGAAEVKKLKFHTEETDFKFNKEYESRRSEGCQRLDFGTAALSAFDDANLTTWGSLIFLTPTSDAGI